jgi:protein phosphatase
MNRVELHHGAATDVGAVRTVNEDSYLAAPPIFVVADGMGGHEGGDVASGIVVEEFGRLAVEGYDPKRGAQVVAATLQICQDRILNYAAGQGARGIAQRRQAGTTAVVALLVEQDGEPKWLLANLGDSRIYRFADGGLQQVSVDHSVVQELIDAGRITPHQAATHPERHVITRALGNPGGVEADYFLLSLQSVERLVLCTDGVTGMISDDHLGQILTDSHDPRDAADRIVAAALSAGGEDNATVIVVDVVGLVTENHYDSAQQRVSLEQKLGALP